MYTVYVLYSLRFQKIYIGYTSNLEERLKSHNELGKKGWTIKYRPWEVLYTEHFELKQDAMKREQELKTAAGQGFIWNIVRSRYAVK